MQTKYVNLAVMSPSIIVKFIFCLTAVDAAYVRGVAKTCTLKWFYAFCHVLSMYLNSCRSA